MMEGYAIEVENLGKQYHLFASARQQFAYLLTGKTNAPSFWAVRDVNFEVVRGESFGIIGHNGSGKSTTLQMIAGILTPTEGHVHTSGRVAALLELGAGFDPQITGRQNIFLNATIYGLTRHEIEEKFDEIAAFADIGAHLDQPVKTYSSGMFVRLAFALQVCINPDILIVDEALAVGDVFFRRKCYARIRQLQEGGCAIIFVSHSVSEVEQICDRAMLLSKGEAKFIGAASKASKYYYSGLLLQQDSSTTANATATSHHATYAMKLPDESAFMVCSDNQLSSDMARPCRIAICNASLQPCNGFEHGEELHVFYECETLNPIAMPIGGVQIWNEKNNLIFGKTSYHYGWNAPKQVHAGTRIMFHQTVKLDIAAGSYVLDIGCSYLPQEAIDLMPLSTQQFADMMVPICQWHAAASFVVSEPRDIALHRGLHYGIAVLQGDCDACLAEQADKT